MTYKAKTLKQSGVVLLLALVLLMGAGVLMAAGADTPAEGESEEGNNGEGMGALGKAGLAIGAALAVGLSAIGTGYAQGKIGAAGMGALAEKPELTGPVFISIAIPETLVILGFVTATIIILMLK